MGEATIRRRGLSTSVGSLIEYEYDDIFLNRREKGYPLDGAATK
jgi:hypothetical protein